MCSPVGVPGWAKHAAGTDGLALERIQSMLREDAEQAR